MFDQTPELLVVLREGYSQVILRAQEVPMVRLETEFGLVWRSAGARRASIWDVRGKPVRGVKLSRYSNQGATAEVVFAVRVRSVI